jgi:hypothetical protein
LLAPLRGSKHVLATEVPWAYAHGYLLPSLRDSEPAQHQKAQAKACLNYDPALRNFELRAEVQDRSPAMGINPLD